MNHNSEKISEFVRRYNGLKEDTSNLRKQLDDLHNKKYHEWRLRKILHIDGALAHIIHDVLDLRMDAEITQSEIISEQSDEFRVNVNALLCNIIRLQDFLLSLQRINTHSYIKYSCYSALVIAVISLGLGVISVYPRNSQPTTPVPCVHSSLPSSAVSVLDIKEHNLTNAIQQKRIGAGGKGLEHTPVVNGVKE